MNDDPELPGTPRSPLKNQRPRADGRAEVRVLAAKSADRGIPWLEAGVFPVEHARRDGTDGADLSLDGHLRAEGDRVSAAPRP